MRLEIDPAAVGRLRAEALKLLKPVEDRNPGTVMEAVRAIKAAREDLRRV